jgi:DNA-binding response OmpR family regulator
VSSEEDLSELELLAYFLRGAGFRVVWAHDIDLSPALLTGTIDCVVMDAALSDGSRNSVAVHAMRLQVPAVMLSRSPHSRRGRHSYIRRPIFLPELRDAISAALRRRDEIIAACQRHRPAERHRSDGRF